MQRSQSYPGVSLRDRSDERATLRELIDTCLRNAANAFRILSLEGESLSLSGMSSGSTVTYPSLPTYVFSVINLYQHIPDAWRTEDVKTHASDLRPDKLEDDNREPNWTKNYWTASDLHHAIIEMLIARKELDETKMPRTLVD
jgi:hypothetical protein